MKIKPLFERVVLKSISQDNSKSKFILPEKLNEKSQIAVVVEVGTGGNVDGEKIEFQVNVGDKVIFNKFSAHEFNIEDETFIIISQNDILGILKD